MVWDWLLRLVRKKKDEIVENEDESSFKYPKLDFDLRLRDQVHEIMAVCISSIARLYPKQYDLIRIVLMEYTVLIEEILKFRETGNPIDLFLKLQTFIDRSIKPYVKGEEKQVNAKILALIEEAFATVEETIEKDEKVVVTVESEVKKVVSTEKKIVSLDEDWTGLVTEIQKGEKLAGRKITDQEPLQADDPVIKIKGIGDKRAKELNAMGIITVEQYVKYKKEIVLSEDELKDNQDE